MSAADDMAAFETWWDGPAGPYMDDAPREWTTEKRRSWCAWQAALAALSASARPATEQAIKNALGFITNALTILRDSSNKNRVWVEHSVRGVCLCARDQLETILSKSVADC